MSLAAFCLTTVLVFILILESYTPGGPIPICAQETQAPQKPMDQIIAQGPELVYRGNNKNHNQHTSSMQVPTTAPLDLWEAAMTKETTMCLLLHNNLHDFHMAQRMVNPAHMRKTIRFRLPCSHARRWSISMYHQLHG